jgi:hypothetical protein
LRALFRRRRATTGCNRPLEGKRHAKGAPAGSQICIRVDVTAAAGVVGFANGPEGGLRP